MIQAMLASMVILAAARAIAGQSHDSGLGEAAVARLKTAAPGLQSAPQPHQRRRIDSPRPPVRHTRLCDQATARSVAQHIPALLFSDRFVDPACHPRLPFRKNKARFLSQMSFARKRNAF